MGGLIATSSPYYPYNVTLMGYPNSHVENHGFSVVSEKVMQLFTRP
jgi:hypothetical protein